jgi:hypothetical protein
VMTLAPILINFSRSVVLGWSTGRGVSLDVSREA